MVRGSGDGQNQRGAGPLWSKRCLPRLITFGECAGCDKVHLMKGPPYHTRRPRAAGLCPLPSLPSRRVRSHLPRPSSVTSFGILSFLATTGCSNSPLYVAINPARSIQLGCSSQSTVPCGPCGPPRSARCLRSTHRTSPTTPPCHHYPGQGVTISPPKLSALPGDL